MDSDTTPQLVQPKSYLQDDLPTELLERILLNLDTPHLAIARIVCRRMAAVGLHLVHEVLLVFRRDKFKALIEIAKHPEMSQRVRKLYYDAWCCSFMGFDEYRKMTFRRDYSEHDLQQGYEALRKMHQDQVRIIYGRYDVGCLQAFFENCPKLREITIGLFSELGTLNIAMTSSRDTLMAPRNDKKWFEAGVRPVLAVAEAAAQTGLKADSLTLIKISHQLFGGLAGLSEGEENRQVRVLKALFKPLHRLRLHIQATPPPENKLGNLPGNSNAFSDQAVRNFHTGFFTELLEAAKDLRVLKLRFPSYDVTSVFPDRSVGNTRRMVALRHVLGEIAFPHLYALSIKHCLVEPGYLVALLLRHKATLRRLKLADILMANENWTWRRIFTALSRSLPQLRKVTFEGAFVIRWEREITFWTPGEFDHSEKICLAHDALVDFIVRGGNWPGDLLAAPAPSGQEGEPHEIHDLGELEGYVSPGRPDDDKEADDPVLRYAPDRYD